MSFKCKTAAIGGVTLWAVATENDKTYNVGWSVLYLSDLLSYRYSCYFFRGQNAVNGELGQGEDKPKSATKPLQIETLAELDVLKYVHSIHQLAIY